MKLGAQGHLRLLAGYARAQPRHDLDPVVIHVQKPLRSVAKRITGFDRRVRVHGQIDIRSGRRINSKKLSRCDSYHRERNIVDENVLARGIREAPEMPLTETRAYDCDGGGRRVIIARGNHPAGDGGNAKADEIVPGHILPFGNLRLSLDQYVERAGWVVGENTGEQGAILVEEFECRIWKNTGSVAKLGIVVNRPAHAMHNRWPAAVRRPARRTVPLQNDERGWGGNRQ